MLIAKTLENLTQAIKLGIGQWFRFHGATLGFSRIQAFLSTEVTRSQSFANSSPSLSIEVGCGHRSVRFDRVIYYSHNGAFLCLPLFFVSSVAIVRFVVCP